MCKDLFGGEIMFGLSAKKECQKLIKKKSNKIVDFFIKGATSEFMCSALKMCIKSFPFRSKRGVFNELESESESELLTSLELVSELNSSESHMKSQLNGGFGKFHNGLLDFTSKCHMCKKAVKESEKFLMEKMGKEKNRVMHEII